MAHWRSLPSLNRYVYSSDTDGHEGRGLMASFSSYYYFISFAPYSSGMRGAKLKTDLSATAGVAEKELIRQQHY